MMDGVVKGKPLQEKLAILEREAGIPYLEGLWHTALNGGWLRCSYERRDQNWISLWGDALRACANTLCCQQRESNGGNWAGIQQMGLPVLLIHGESCPEWLGKGVSISAPEAGYLRPKAAEGAHLLPIPARALAGTPSASERDARTQRDSRLLITQI